MIWISTMIKNQIWFRVYIRPDHRIYKVYIIFIILTAYKLPMKKKEISQPTTLDTGEQIKTSKKISWKIVIHSYRTNRKNF